MAPQQLVPLDEPFPLEDGGAVRAGEGDAPAAGSPQDFPRGFHGDGSDGRPDCRTVRVGQVRATGILPRGQSPHTAEGPSPPSHTLPGQKRLSRLCDSTLTHSFSRKWLGTELKSLKGSPQPLTHDPSSPLLTGTRAGGQCALLRKGAPVPVSRPACAFVLLTRFHRPVRSLFLQTPRLQSRVTRTRTTPAPGRTLGKECNC